MKKGNKPYISSHYYRGALLTDPNVVIIMFGTNDSKKGNWDRNRFMLDYHKMIRSFQVLPSRPKIYLMIPPPLYKDGYLLM